MKKETNIITIFTLVWAKRKMIIRNCLIAFVAVVIIAFSIPKEYTSEVKIAPELSLGESGLAGSLGSLAQMAGIDLGGMNNNEAIYPELYPEIVSSTPFLTEMLQMEVVSKDGDLCTDMLDYLTNHQKQTWWSAMLKPIKNLFKKKETGVPEDITTAQSTQLSRDQQLLLESFGKSLNVTLDKTTSMISVSATMQDPLIAATTATAVAEKLQTYVDKYRTAKERDNIVYLEALHRSSHEKYREAQRAYANYTDSHQNAILAKVTTEQENLENEMQLAYSVYEQVSQQLEAAKAKLQEKKPISVVIQPALTPIKASSPKKILMAFLYVFTTFFLTVAWIILKIEIKQMKKETAKTEEENDKDKKEASESKENND